MVVPAAGEGRRLGGRRKAFLDLGGEPVLKHALAPFLEHPRVTAVVVVLPVEQLEAPPAWLRELDSRIRLVEGGASRFESVLAGLEALGEAVEVALVHDAARPLVTRPILDRCIAAAEAGEGAVAGWPSTDSLKKVDEGRRVVASPDRERIWRAQTPQGFPRRALLEAYRRAAARGGAGATDDAGVFMAAGGSVRMVEGGAWNLKLTHPEDLEVAELLLSRAGGAASGATRLHRVSADPADEDTLAGIIEHLVAGGLLAYPTETVYGLGGVVRPEVIERLGALKGRSAESPFLVLAASPDELRLNWTSEATALAAAFWPGPLTLVLADPEGRFPPGVRSVTGGVAVRVSPHPFVRALTRGLGEPLLSTSANVAGAPAAASADDVAYALEGRPGADELWLADGGRLEGSPPSTVVDCTTEGAPRLVRSGALPVERLRDVSPVVSDS